MNHALTILWPVFAAPDIEEIRFSYDFCRKLSRRFCAQTDSELQWIDCTADKPLCGILPRIKGERVLLVTEPEIVISSSAIKVLTKCLEMGYRACGPVYNQTLFPHQTAALPAPYVDMDTFGEVADILARTQGIQTVPVDSLDPASLLFHTRLLTAVPEHTLFSELPKLIDKMERGAMAVAPGALVHSGFVKGLETERLDLVGLVPEGVKRVLDIGCAMGGYGKILRQERPGIHLTGVELNPAMAEAALPYYDEIISRPVEDAAIEGIFDLINCGDILEHLQDPWKILTYLQGLLTDGGCLVLSIPNAGHWSIVRALLKGDFQYVPLGLLCIGHLRWFTESTIRSALEEAGFSIDFIQRQELPPTPQGEAFIRGVCNGGIGLEPSLRTNEFLIRAVKRRRQHCQGEVSG